MFRKRNDKELDIGKINSLVLLGNKVFQILLVMLIVAGVYIGIKVLKELQIFPFILTILKLLLPLFIGLFIAWLLDPIVSKLKEKGIRRGFGTAICYIIFLGIVFLIVNALIPLLSEQINEFVSNTIPGVYDACRNWINNIFDKFNGIENFDANGMKLELFAKLESIATNLTSSLPAILVTFVTNLFSGVGTFAIGMIIGFYILLDFDKHVKLIYSLVPNHLQKDAYTLVKVVDEPLKRFVIGAIIDCSVVFIISFIGFAIIGLKAPLLFGLFCGITNVIPYAGPYIGGAPAVLVAFSQGTPIGIAVLIFIAVVQALEGNLFQPLIMSKTTKLSPITIILGLLVFGHFFGIIGMVLATPIIGAVKGIILFFDSKYNFLRPLEE
ncbi:MAG: AI-2E family transporter [Candidatus Faecisoma sp.]|nr:AI-2E family transporter [Acholeplasma sp.]MDY2892512.1 AI-2E family transporter [Candidatus Faecisoma sp.]